MNLSVVIPTLNGRDRLGACLDALATHAPNTEVIVVNGPSADGTTGMVKARDDVDVLIEIADRNDNVARNAGIAAASGSIIGFLKYNRLIDDSWVSAIKNHLSAAAAAVTGPSHDTVGDEHLPLDDPPTSQRYNEENIAIRREALEVVDGFDEHLPVGGVQDLVTRLIANNHTIDWEPAMAVRSAYGTDGGSTDPDRFMHYRAFAYQLTKNEGFVPNSAIRLFGNATRDAIRAARGIIRGSVSPSGWFADGKDVIRGLLVGSKDGLLARYANRDGAHNPYGLSSQDDRAVRLYDWR